VIDPPLDASIHPSTAALRLVSAVVVVAQHRDDCRAVSASFISQIIRRIFRDVINELGEAWRTRRRKVS